MAAVGATSISYASGKMPATEKEFYEMRVYQLPGNAGKVELEKYLTGALLPLLEKHGARLGAFEELDMEEPPRIYILLIFPNAQTYLTLQEKFGTDQEYLEKAKNYFELPASKPVFERYETFLMEAFDAIPQHRSPDKNRGLIELRTYESYNEGAGLRKIAMFNNEELPLFDKVNLHPVFFSKILAGKYMPALMYMLWFNNMDEREANWKVFRESEEWKTMSAKDIYADTVSKVHKKFLKPLPYSQI